MAKITKSDFIQKFAQANGLTNAQAERLVNSFFDVIKNELKVGNEIQFTGMLSMSVGDRKAREGKNPQTGQPIKIPASKVVKIRVGKNLKDIVK